MKTNQHVLASLLIITNAYAHAAEPTSTNSPNMPSSSAAERPVYKPPNRGAPDSRVGGGTRGNNAERLILQTLAPPHTGLTAEPSPTLYWYISSSTQKTVEIAIADDTTSTPLLKRPVDYPVVAGMHRIDLGAQKLRLLEGREYQWSIAVINDPSHRSNDIVASATIRYSPPAADVRIKLRDRPSKEKVSFFAEAGYWYDAIHAAAIPVARTGHMVHVESYVSPMLKQVELPESAAYIEATGE